MSEQASAFTPNVVTIVVRSGLSDRRQLPLISDLINEGHLKNLSVILNGTDPKHSYGYSYGYEYNDNSN